MFETSSDDLFLFPYQEDEAVVSLAEALLPLVECPSPPLVPWMCSTRYKTELCSRYAETGSCKYAERCQFAHGLHDLHVSSRHPKYKTELCRTFHTTGYCLYGTRCLFVHSPKEQRPASRCRSFVPCRTYRSFGVCPYGTRCNFLHIEGGGGGGGDLESPENTPMPLPTRPRPHSQEWRPRGALCRTFSSFGFCLYGTRCRFQHGLPSALSGQRGGGGCLSLPTGRTPSPASDMFSSSPSSSSSPPSALASPAYPEDASPLVTPLNDPMAHSAFTFSSQQLNDLLLPLALRLQQLENSQAGSQDEWDSKAL